MAMAAMIGKGTYSGLSVISQRTHSGDDPPGRGKMRIAVPSQVHEAGAVHCLDIA